MSAFGLGYLLTRKKNQALMADSISLTRGELYDRFWTTPLVNLTSECGMSGRGLAKLSIREKIPVPGRG